MIWEITTVVDFDGNEATIEIEAEYSIVDREGNIYFYKTDSDGLRVEIAKLNSADNRLMRIIEV